MTDGTEPDKSMENGTAADASVKAMSDTMPADLQTPVDQGSFTMGENIQISGPSSKARVTWAGKMEFMLSAVGYAVGLGNVWRFPYLCYDNGGGAFLVPYLIMLALVGLPFFFLELAVGQYASLGALTIWGRMVPILKGLGYTMVFVSLFVSVYYQVIIAYTVFFFFASFTKTLPWSSCCNSWNTCACSINSYLQQEISDTNMTTPSTPLTTLAPTPCDQCINDTQVYNGELRSPAEEYWEYYVLGWSKDYGIYALGEPRWHLTLCLLFSWVVVFFCIMKGIKSSGKVVYFTATFPYVVLFILFIRGVSLPGAGEGIKYYLKPDFGKMKHAKVWKEAAVQILYSLGIGSGSLLTMGSYNKFQNNCHKDALIIAFINCGTSVFAGFVIFSVLGFMAHQTGADIDNVVKSGAGLAFTVYPEALSKMPGAPFWSVIFFFMLFTLGLDSQFASLECIITGFLDEYPILRKHKRTVTVIACGVLFLLGIPCVTRGGTYVIHFMDKFVTAWPLLIVTILEAIHISWIYGYKRFLTDIELMIGFRPSMYWAVSWMICTPLLLSIIFILSCLEYDGIYHEETDYHYPGSSEAIGWLTVVAFISFIPVYMIIRICKFFGSWQTFWWWLRGPSQSISLHFKDLIYPHDSWGPALPENRQQQHAKQQQQQQQQQRPAEDVTQNIVPPTGVENPTYTGNIQVTLKKDDGDSYI